MPSIRSYAIKQCLPAVSEIDDEKSLAEFVSQDHIAFVVQLKPSDRQRIDNFTAVAALQHEKFLFGIKFHSGPSSIVAYRSFGREKINFGSPTFDTDAIFDFIETSATTSAVAELELGTFHEFLEVIPFHLNLI